MDEKQYTVTGMSCAACSARVEKAVSQVNGVNLCRVNLLTNSMTVGGTASPESVISAVENAGYGASIKGEIPVSKNPDVDDDFKGLKHRLIWSLGFLIILMYVSMGHIMWGFPLYEALSKNHIAIGIIQLLLTIAIMVINKQFFISGFKGILHRAPNMDTLVALGSGASFLYSLYVLFKMTDAQLNGMPTIPYLHDLYFESAGTILALITLGKMLEARSKGKTTNALNELTDLSPKTAVVIMNGTEKTISVSELKAGDVFVVRTGESIPADGKILEGHCTVNESALTGESIPKDKNAGDSVSAATINQSGYIKCVADKVGENTLISQIIKMVSDASSSKAPVAKAADKISGVFVPVVMAISTITFIVWLLCNASPGFALARAISVLVISCPCALGLATPVAIMVGSGIGAKNGILFKNATALEVTGKTKIVALDKTGTITTGKPQVIDVVPLNDYTKSQLLELAYSLEKMSIHPLAVAVCEEAEKAGVSAFKTEDFTECAGHGLRAIADGEEIRSGNIRFISETAVVTDEITSITNRLAASGKTPLIFSIGRRVAGIISVADTIKHDSVDAIADLHNMGIKVIMLTGDNKHTANAIKEQVGIDEVYAEVLPDEKAHVIETLKKQGRVSMVGDGINDAPALTMADTGIAVAAGTDIAIDSADIVLMKNTISDVAAAIRLSRKTLKNIYENLFWAFIYNVLGIPLAAGVLIPIWNIQLNPMFAAGAMSLSSFFVVSNALRLNMIKIYNKKEIKTMEKEVKVVGMMCAHCEAHVKKALEALDGVESAHPNFEKGTVIIQMTKDVADETIKTVIEDLGYNVLD